MATQDEPEAYDRLLGCLAPPNQTWAKQAPVLVISVIRTTFSRNDKPNRTAQHDLGLAVGNLCIEATARGLSVHQMAGVDLAAASEAAEIPTGYEPVTAIAIGYRGETDEAADPSHADRDKGERKRKPLDEMVFGAEFGKPASWLG